MTIRAHLEEACSVQIKIYDRKGMKVKTLVESFVTPEADGTMAVSWDGRNDKGEVVASGIYLLKLTTPRGNDKKKIVVVK